MRQPLLLCLIFLLSGFFLMAVDLLCFQYFTSFSYEVSFFEILILSLTLVSIETFLGRVVRFRRYLRMAFTGIMTAASFAVVAYLAAKTPEGFALNPVRFIIPLIILNYGVLQMINSSACDFSVSVKLSSNLVGWVFISFILGGAMGIAARIPLVMLVGNIGMLLLCGIILILILILFFNTKLPKLPSQEVVDVTPLLGDGVFSRNRFWFSVIILCVTTVFILLSGFWYLKQVSSNNYYSGIVQFLGFMVCLSLGAILSVFMVPNKYRDQSSLLKWAILGVITTCLVSVLSFKNIYQIGNIAWLFSGDGSYSAFWFDSIISLICFGPFAFCLGFLVSIFLGGEHSSESRMMGFPLVITLTFFISWGLFQNLLVPLIGISWIVLALPQAYFLLVQKVTRSWVVMAILITGFSVILLIEFSPLKVKRSSKISFDEHHYLEHKSGLFFIQKDNRDSSIFWNSTIHLNDKAQIYRDLVSMLWSDKNESYLYFGFNSGFREDMAYLNKPQSESIKGNHVLPVSPDRGIGLNSSIVSHLDDIKSGESNESADFSHSNLLKSFQESRDPYDLVIIDMVHPSLPRWGGYLADETFGLMRSKLSEDGWLFLWWPINKVSYRSTSILAQTFLNNFENVQIIAFGVATDNPIIGFIGGNTDSQSPSIDQVKERFSIWKDSGEGNGTVEFLDVFEGYLGGKEWLEKRLTEKTIGQLSNQTILSSIPYHPLPRRSQLLYWISEGLEDSWVLSRNQFYPLSMVNKELSTDWLKRRKAFKSYLNALKNINRADYIAAGESLMESLNHDPLFSHAKDTLNAIVGKIGEKERIFQIEVLNFLKSLNRNSI